MISVTELRANIYKLLDQVAESGVALDVDRGGKRLRISVVEPEPKLSRLVRRDVVAADPESLVKSRWEDEWKGAREL